MCVCACVCVRVCVCACVFLLLNKGNLNIFLLPVRQTESVALIQTSIKLNRLHTQRQNGRRRAETAEDQTGRFHPEAPKPPETTGPTAPTRSSTCPEAPDHLARHVSTDKINIDSLFLPKILWIVRIWCFSLLLMTRTEQDVLTYTEKYHLYK